MLIYFKNAQIFTKALEAAKYEALGVIKASWHLFK
jgi:hypothetical protein